MFAIGRPPPKAELKRRAAQRHAARRKATKTAASPNVSFKITSPFCIFSTEAIPEPLRFVAPLMGSTLTQASELVERYALIAATNPFAAEANKAFTRRFLGNAWKNKGLFGINHKFIEQMILLIRAIMRVRLPLRNLVRTFLSKRHKEACPYDLFTMEPPKQPVTIVDWPTRHTYTFEARTMFIDVQRRLLNHDQLFAAPQALRNPFTNADLTYGQQLSLYQQLQAAGYSHWTLEGLRLHNFNLAETAVALSLQLRLAAVDSVFYNKTHEDFIDLVLDFIEAEHETHEYAFSEWLYRWALINKPEVHLIQQWKKMCYAYYRTAILYEATPQIKMRQLQLTVYSKTKPLCKRPEGLIRDYKESIKGL